MCSDGHGVFGCMSILVLLAVLQLLITCPSCSVKENRELCPCRLELEFSGEDASKCEDGVIVTLSGISGSADGYILRDTVVAQPDDGCVRWFTEAPKGDMIISAVYPNAVKLEKDIRSGTLLNIPLGKEAPQLWSFGRKVLLRKEVERHTVTLAKNYCHLVLLVQDASGESFPFRMEIRGNVCGYSLEGNPVAGDFRTVVKYVDENTLPSGMVEGYVDLPRQTDNSLCLDIISEDEKVRTFALGNYIEASGYDWTSENLKDITMNIDYARTSINFSIGAWKKSEHFEVVI